MHLAAGPFDFSYPCDPVLDRTKLLAGDVTNALCLLMLSKAELPIRTMDDYFLCDADPATKQQLEAANQQHGHQPRRGPAKLQRVL